MLATLHVAVNKDAELAFRVYLKTAMNAPRICIGSLWMEDENVGFGAIRDVVDMFEDICSYASGFGIHDECGLDVDSSTSLSHVSGVGFYSLPPMLTSVIGVSFKILALILCTTSESPDMQTFVIRADKGPRCIPGTGFGLDEVTVAWIVPPLASLIALQSVRRLSTFLRWTGSSWFGVPSAVPSGCVHRAKAPGLAYIISSPSGPARFEANGTLKERLTGWPDMVVLGDMDVVLPRERFPGGCTDSSG